MAGAPARVTEKTSTPKAVFPNVHLFGDRLVDLGYAAGILFRGKRLEEAQLPRRVTGDPGLALDARANQCQEHKLSGT